MPKTRSAWVINQPFSATSNASPVGASVTTGGGSGTDHGTLSGLGDDDHTQYHNNTRGDARYYTQSAVDALLHDRQHDIVAAADHTVTGTQYQLVGVSATDTVGLLNSSTDTSASTGTQGIYFLRTDINGDVTVNQLNADALDVGGAVTVDSLAVTTSATIGTTLGVTGAVDFDSTLDVAGIAALASDLTVGGDTTLTGDLGSANWVSGTSGWGIDSSTGMMDLQTVQAKNAEFEAIIAEALRAQAGGVLITPSFAEITRDFTVPLPGESGTLYTSDLAGLDGWASLAPGADIQITTYEGLYTGAPHYVASSHASDTGSGATTPTYVDEDFETPVAVDDTDVDGWNDTAANNSMTTDATKFVVVSDSGQRYKTTSSSSNFHTHFDGTNYATLTNYTYTGKIKFGNADVGGGITFFSDYPNSDSYYRIRRYNSNKTFHVANHGWTDVADMTGTTTCSFDPADATNVNNWINFKVQVSNAAGSTTIKARFWKDGDSEPGSWHIDCSDSDMTRATEGTVGIWAHNAGNGLSVDDLLVQGTGTAIDTDVVCNTPTGIRDGDFLVATCAYTYSTAHPSAPTGWTAAGSPLHYATVGGYGVSMFYRTWSSGDATTMTVEHDNSSEVIVSIAAYRGGSGGTPSFSLSTDSASTDVDANSVNTSQYALHTVAHVQVGATTGTVSDDSDSYSSLTTVTSDDFKITYHSDTMGDISTTGTVEFTSTVSGNFIVLSMSVPPSTANESFSWGSAWGSIASVSPGDLEDGEIAYTFTTHTGSWGGGKTARAGSLALDYGTSGDGYIKLTTLDDAGSPYMDIATRATWDSDTQSLNPTVHTRIGNLGGLGVGFSADEWGTYIAGQVTYAGYGTFDTRIVMSTDQSYFKNARLEWIDELNETAMYIDPSQGIIFYEGDSITRRIDFSGTGNSYGRLYFTDYLLLMRAYDDSSGTSPSVSLGAQYSTTHEATIVLTATSSNDYIIMTAGTITLKGELNLGDAAGDTHMVTGHLRCNDGVTGDDVRVYNHGTFAAGTLFFSPSGTDNEGVTFDESANRFYFFADSTSSPPAYTSGDVAKSSVGMGIMELYPQGSAPAYSSYFARIWVDSSDGDLKVTFSNNTTKVIAYN
jgi:hypothetical protein